MLQRQVEFFAKIRLDVVSQSFDLRIHLAFDAPVNISVENKRGEDAKNYECSGDEQVNVTAPESVLWTSQNQFEKGRAKNQQRYHKSTDDQNRVGNRYGPRFSLKVV